jgi:hypothetical protein
MAWDPTVPVTNAALLSAPVRANFAALDTILVAALNALANGQVLTKGAGPVIGGVPAGTNGYILTLVGGVPLWQPGALTWPLLAPDGTYLLPSYAFASAPADGMYTDGAVSLTSALAIRLRVAGSNLLYLGGSVPGGVWTILQSGMIVPGADNAFDLGSATNRLHDVYLANTLRLTELASAPATPASPLVAVYAKTDHKVYQKDSTGAESLLGGGGGVSAIRLPLEQATLPDGSAGNIPPELVREKSTGVLSGAPSPTRTYARFAGDAAAVAESLLWSFLLPSNYGSGGTLRLKWKAAVATTGTVIWKAGACAVTDGSTDDDAVAFTAVAAASASTAPATQGQSVEVTIPLTTTGFAAYRWVTVFLQRDPVADTMTGTGTAGDAILMGVQFEYTPA